MLHHRNQMCTLRIASLLDNTRTLLLAASLICLFGGSESARGQNAIGVATCREFGQAVIAKGNTISEALKAAELVCIAKVDFMGTGAGNRCCRTAPNFGFDKNNNNKCIAVAFDRKSLNVQPFPGTKGKMVEYQDRPAWGVGRGRLIGEARSRALSTCISQGGKNCDVRIAECL